MEAIEMMNGARCRSIFVATFLIGIYFVRNAETADCSVINIGERIVGRSLQGHVIRSLLVDSDEQCEIQCLTTDGLVCASYNLGPMQQDGKYLCELNKAEHIKYSEDLITNASYVYSSFQTPCSKSHCPQNSTCVPDFIQNNFKCVCPSGYTGKYCEKDIDECSSNVCHTSAACKNTLGSYSCKCRDGFHGDGITSCKCSPQVNQSMSLSSCKELLQNPSKCPNVTAGLFWIDLDGGSHDNAFKVYCDLETAGGGWTLVWSYTFTKYASFNSPSNSVTPRPSWPKKEATIDAPVSTTPPQSETDYNAVYFDLWKTLGKESEILIKSNINNWIKCTPGSIYGGNLLEWKSGRVICRIVNVVASSCQDSSPPSYLNTKVATGPAFSANNNFFYYFAASSTKHWPTHDPCGTNQGNQEKNVANPHGNIFVR